MAELEKTKQIQKKHGVITKREEHYYLTYPEKNATQVFSLQNHWRGESVHWDLRFRYNKHFIGYTFVGLSADTNPPTVENFLSSKKFRIEGKEVGSIAWLNPPKYIPPNRVGSTRYKPARFEIVATGDYVCGALKPYFREYFLRSGKWKNRWVRLVIRGVPSQMIDPVSKKPLPFKEILWTGWVAKDETPYVLSKRYFRKLDWVPPKGVVPFPLDYVEKYKDMVLKFLEVMSEKW